MHVGRYCELPRLRDGSLVVVFVHPEVPSAEKLLAELCSGFEPVAQFVCGEAFVDHDHHILDGLSHLDVKVIGLNALHVLDSHFLPGFDDFSNHFTDTDFPVVEREGVADPVLHPVGGQEIVAVDKVALVGVDDERQVLR